MGLHYDMETFSVFLLLMIDYRCSQPIKNGPWTANESHSIQSSIYIKCFLLLVPGFPKFLFQNSGEM